jgi:caspase domain-containing protein
VETNPSPNYRAVLIGIDDYPQRPLSGCVNDIDQIERILLDRLKVPAERITRFAAPRAGAASSTRLPASLSPTRDELRNFLHRLAEEVGPDDVVFLYYSGHGSQVMTRWNGHVIAREALVPLDFWNDGVSQRLLYDFELNGLFARIAEKAGDLTVVLDCCHSASAVRGDGERYLEIPGIQDLSSNPPTEALTRDASGLLSAAIPMLVAACTAIEKAFEVGGDSQPHQGAFSYSLVRTLDAIDKPLPDLRWWDIWIPLVDRISNLRVWQHPQIVGNSARRLFGGPWTPRDLGYVIRQDGERFRVEAGTLTSVSEGAELAIYGPEPDLFPALDTGADRAARIGLVRVDKADRSYCTAVSANGALRLPEGARARLVKPGLPDRLVVSLEPFDPALAARLEARGIEAVRPGSPGIEACARRENGLLHLGDEIYGDGSDPGRPPLVSFPAEEPDLAEAVLGHYARYRQTLRLPLRCRDLNGALRIEMLDCGSRPVLSPEDLQAPSFPQLPFDAPWRYKVREGEGFALRIDNMAEDTLSVFVLNCSGSGRVEYLGDAEIPAGSLHILWCDGNLGSPFYPAVGADRKEIVDRIVVVGTTLPDRDLRYLQVAESFADVIRRYRISEPKDALSRALEATPVEKWTAEMVTLRIYK